ncbi:hypothetical protein [Trichlorobacter lovleyi]|nr:hypothetical protein [Trichlorobacter lovleyi]
MVSYPVRAKIIDQALFQEYLKGQLPRITIIRMAEAEELDACTDT